ncbi:bluetail domain-containing putative surface protein [Caulobacter sp. 1776]|uniref:bluetail domain-containing putative surface protein n=1 Tax=Caulobacter sp. 1776 TaxID=3156420 RepID=UPI0033938EF7
MATIDNLVSIYRNVHRLPANSDLPANAWSQLTLMAQGIDIARGGQIAGDVWTYASAVSWIQDSAKATTEVAVMSYGFLADITLGTAGLDYLVSATGSNPNNLNSAYYAGFNLENRYINFATNLIKYGEGHDAFVAAYGENGSPINTFQKTYQKLFGVEKSLDETLAFFSAPVPDGHGGTYARLAYFEEIGGDGSFGIGTRAAMVGWLMAEAVKSGQGPYVEAMRAYLADVGVDGQVSPLSTFLSVYGKGGDHAPGGGADPGLPGETARFSHDWNVDAFNQEPDDNTHVLASDGNDVIKPVVGDQGGLDANRHIRTAAGNDIVVVDNGVMRGLIDTGTGNDTIFLEKLDGRVITGAGHDDVDIGSFAGLHLTNGKATDIAVIEDFQKGFDLLSFAGVAGPGEKKQIFFIATATFDDALTAYAGLTAANSNTVFEWGNDTYIFHNNATAGLDAGDGLIKLAGVTGLTVGKATEVADILFAA